MTNPFHSKGLASQESWPTDEPNKALLESLNLGCIFLRDQHERITFWSQGAQQLYGFSANEALGNLCDELLKTQFAQPKELCMRTLLEQGSWQGQLVRRRKDGQQVLVVSQWKLQRDGAQRPLTIVETGLELHHTPEGDYLEQIVENAPVGIAVVEASELRYVMVNPFYRAIPGEHVPVLGHTISEVFPEPTATNLSALLRQVIVSGESVTVPEFEALVGNEKRSTWWDATFIPLRRPSSGQVHAVMIVAVDMTPHVEARQRAARVSAQTELSLKQLDAVIAGMAQALVISDPQGKVLRINPAALELYGFRSYQEMLGKLADYFTFFELHAPHDDHLIPLEEWPLSRALKGEAVLNEEYRGVRKDTGKSWIASYSSIPVRDSSGKIILAFVTIHDLTAMKEVERARREAERKFRVLTETATFGMIIGDSQGRVYYANPAYLKMLGYSVEDVESGRLRWDRITPPEWLPADRRAVEEIYQKGVAAPYEKEYIARDGYRVPILVGLTLLEQQPNKAILAGFVLDLTLLKHAQQEIQRINSELASARDAALQASEAKSRFLANMSHELRTPLNAIIGYSEMLEEEAEEAGLNTLCDDLERIQVAGRHLLALISDILDLSKIEAGRMSVTLESFNLDELVNETVQTARPLAEKNSNRFEAELQSPLGNMYADPLKVRQILYNLLSNAAKFTESGKMGLKARRIDYRREPWIEFRVWDTGVGITPEEKGKLFTKFYQAERKLLQKTPGTGLGLAITKQFCDILGGEIEVHSTPGQGSSFTVRLPANVRLRG